MNETTARLSILETHIQQKKKRVHWTLEVKLGHIEHTVCNTFVLVLNSILYCFAFLSTLMSNTGHVRRILDFIQSQ